MACAHCKCETFDENKYCEECKLELKDLRNTILFGLGFIAVGIIISILTIRYMRSGGFFFYGLVVVGFVQIAQGLRAYKKTKNIRIADPRTGQTAGRNLQMLRGLPVEPEAADMSYANKFRQQTVNNGFQYVQGFPYMPAANGMVYPEEKRKQSTAGVIAFIISIINAALIIGSDIVIVIAQKLTETWGGLILFYSFFLVVGLIAGITGLVQRKKDKKYAKIGMIIHAATFGLFIISFFVMAFVLPESAFATV